MTETDNEIYQEIKKKGTLKGQKLTFLNYLCLFGPCSTNELIYEIKQRKLVKNELELNKLNRHPSVLKRMGIIEIHSKRKCKTNPSSKEVEVIQIVSRLPDLKKNPMGKALKLIKNSINAALLAVEIYNKPRSTFRTECFISMMNNAWTKLFHAYIGLNEGDIYYYPQKGKIRKTWDLTKCINHTNILKESVKANIKLFIGLRNEIEHGLVDEIAIDVSLFGECQSLLYNYEGFLIEHFGQDFSLNQSLAFSLQFSLMRDSSQEIANKNIMSNEAKNIMNYLKKYRNNLTQEIYNSQEFSVKLLQVPRISNTSRGDLAIRFVKYDGLSEEDKEKFKKVDALIKTQVKKIPVANAGLFKPKQCEAEINHLIPNKINPYDLKCLYSIFKVKPERKNMKNFYKAIENFCIYDEINSEYLYTRDWIDFVIDLFVKHNFTTEKIRAYYKKRTTLKYSKYL